MITEKQKQTAWGDKLIEQLSRDLQSEFPDIKGFSRTNLLYCKQFFNYFQFVSLVGGQISPQVGGQLQSSENQNNVISPQVGVQLQSSEENNTIVPQVGGQLQSIENQNNVISPQVGGQINPQLLDKLLRKIIFNIPWGHIKVIINKIKDLRVALFYFNQTIENGWSRDVLALQIKNQLHNRQGKAVTNFNATLPSPLSDLAQQTLKDPYVFDFFMMIKPYHEKDIENQLVEHITKFILELGKGFAFVGRQYHLTVANSDYYIDLLFYHIRLKCYVVIELKNTKFIPEYAGKLNFYLSAVDSLLKQSDDNPTIGILLCRDKNNIEAEFAFRDINKPMGVSEFNLIEAVPENLKSNLPSVEEFENELNKLINDDEQY
jgi:predicted nuclease of restriction endonuclease-like (RecB) superfamily